MRTDAESGCRCCRDGQAERGERRCCDDRHGEHPGVPVRTGRRFRHRVAEDGPTVACLATCRPGGRRCRETWAGGAPGQHGPRGRSVAQEGVATAFRRPVGCSCGGRFAEVVRCGPQRAPRSPPGQKPPARRAGGAVRPAGRHRYAGRCAGVHCGCSWICPDGERALRGDCL